MSILKRENRFYMISMLIAAAVCVLWVALVKSIPYSDFNYYYALAKQIAGGGSFGDTYTSVGYSIVLGLIYSIFGKTIFVAKVFNLILTIISYFLMYSLLRKINISETKKRVIFILFIFFPTNIFYNSLLAVEILFTMLLLLITNIYFSDNKFKYVFIGVLAGVETMIKPFFIAFFFAIFLVEVIKNKKLLKPITNSLIVLILSCVVIAPFVYRNTKMMGQFTSVANNGGIVLYINNNSQNKWGRWMPAADVKNSIVLTTKYKKANMTEKNKMLSAAAKKWIKSHPKQFLILGCKRLLNTYFVGDDILFTYNGTNLSSEFKNKLMVYTNFVRNIIFLPGIIAIIAYSIKVIKMLIKRKENEIDRFDLYALIIFYMFTGVYFITEGQGRYAFPFVFIMIYFFCSWSKFLKKKAKY
ncbi:glycosyltransferase family 39 protein [Clostridium guangxiense]|uniref:glycosyltransferase family 39 protein n=1 Tax=Clostridium guangxiense TaxID=1662055 RepID=UPI001E37C8C8|nr:glycosyltransferase family 39 protein [Clostridium guangxiense]MCD2348668.1 glycosyltransferase family 39 protein [Clostridium guangxiense]